jgi:hypothetical protein
MLTIKEKKAIASKMSAHAIAMAMDEINELIKQNPSDPAIKQAKKDFDLFHAELKKKGYTFDYVDCPHHGKELAFKKYDYLAHSPCKMKVPSISALLSMPLPTDLPKHGYLTK